MEKLVYLLLGPGRPLEHAVASALTTETAPELRRLGAWAVQVNVADPALGSPFGVEPDGRAEQILAAVSVWVDTAEGNKVLPALPGGSSPDARWHGWLVSESEPLPNRTRPPGPDGRVPGFAQLVGLTLPANLSWTEWRRLWQGGHTSVAVNTQATFRYVQNVVFRPLTAGAPPYVGLVEECFPLEAATDLHVFFDAVGDEARLARHMAAMSESCDRFMDSAAPVAWTTEWVFR